MLLKSTTRPPVDVATQVAEDGAGVEAAVLAVSADAGANADGAIVGDGAGGGIAALAAPAYERADGGEETVARNVDERADVAGAGGREDALAVPANAFLLLRPPGRNFAPHCLRNTRSLSFPETAAAPRRSAKIKNGFKVTFTFEANCTILSRNNVSKLKPHCWGNCFLS